MNNDDDEEEEGYIPKKGKALVFNFNDEHRFVKKKVDNFLRRTAQFGSMEEEYSLYCKCFNGETVGFTPARGQSLLTREEFMALAPQTVSRIVIN